MRPQARSKATTSLKTIYVKDRIARGTGYPVFLGWGWAIEISNQRYVVVDLSYLDWL